MMAAMGATLIILRHGEKPAKAEKNGSLQLSPKGKARAQFIARTYLGRGATKPFFGKGGPHAFFAITPHTVETASPSAETWNLPVSAFCTAAAADGKDPALDARTADAAKTIHHALKRGRDVVVVWEHHRIADARLPELQTTLWKLLNLDRVGAPDTWPDDDYDTIWRIECGASGKPRKFRAFPQGFRPKHKRQA